jgi:undecaprenyl-diphosphatase
MIECIQEIDWYLFAQINNHWGNGLFDSLLVPFRNKYFWIPLYVMVISVSIWKFGWKGLVWVLFALLTVGISDPTSSDLIKKNVQRPRPCKHTTEQYVVIERVTCGSGYSFTSSHATNHMSVSAFIFFTLGHLMGTWRWIWPAWAIIIGYAQIYVGVHFPGDVLAGFILGAAIGYVISRIYRMMPFSITPHPET